MASEIRVNTINNRSGLGTISITNSGAVFSGVTTFAQIKTTSGEVTVGTGASVFSPATNVLALGTNNTEKVRIDSSGSVGIGTDNPQENLHIYNSSGSSRIRLTSGNSSDCSIFFGAIDDSATGGIQYNHSDDSLRFNGYNNAERLRITSSGNIGIGTNDPSALLEVKPGSSGQGILLKTTANVYGTTKFDSNRTSESNYLGTIDYAWNGTTVAQIVGVAGDDTVNKDNARIAFYTAAAGSPAHRATIDSSGRLLLGVESSSVQMTQLLQGNSASGASYGTLYLARGVNNPSDGNFLGEINFSDNSHDSSASIRAVRDGGTWTSTSSQPSALQFSTTSNGQSDPTERLRITSGGRISINNTSGPTDIPGTAHDTVVVGNPTATGGGITLEVASGNNCGFQMYAQGSQPAARFLYDGSINAAHIYSQNSGGTSESVRMTFREDGDVSITNGDLILASGHGIDFSATSNGGTTTPSELLDDYEEGTWTPSIKFGGNSVGMTYTRQEGHYTKIGRQVFAQFRITLSSKGTSTGTMRIEGLPFTAADVFTSTGVDGQVHMGHDDGLNSTNASNNPISGYVEGGTDYIILTARDSNAALSTLSNSYVDDNLSISASAIFYA